MDEDQISRLADALVDRFASSDKLANAVATQLENSDRIPRLIAGAVSSKLRRALRYRTERVQQFTRCDARDGLKVRVHQRMASEPRVRPVNRNLAAIGFEMADMAISMGSNRSRSTGGMGLLIQRRDRLAEQCPQDARFLESMAW